MMPKSYAKNKLFLMKGRETSMLVYSRPEKVAQN